MRNAILGGIVVIIGLWWAIGALIKTDLERVEDKMEHLLELARDGGGENADEIIEAFHSEYRGSRPFGQKFLTGRIRDAVGQGLVETLQTGGYKAIKKPVQKGSARQVRARRLIRR